jgi:peptidoglycan/xylan/chitin deacetylase (PgdA/CDA1 family)
MPAAQTEVVLTFDNLGEAADEERGLPLGALPHYSVTQILPRLLELLDAHQLRATFFVEAINTERYPDALAEILAGGHELGCHGWRHEMFGQLPPSERPAIIERSVAALRGAGAAVEGFRPPGGIVTPYDLTLLAARGIRWCSPAGATAGIDRGIVCVPFRWPLIDAFYMAPALAPLRAASGLSERPLPLGSYLDAVNSELDRIGQPDPPTTVCLIMHPFLYENVDQLDALIGLFERLARLDGAGAVNVGRGVDAAARLRDSGVLGPPTLDIASWA